MIPWLVTASAAPVRLDRVDLLSETPGTWLATELPRAAAAPGTVAARWVAQVSPVVTWGRCELSASLAAQSLGVSLPLDPVRPVSFDAAAVARAGLPIGARVGFGVGIGRVRFGLSAVTLSDATWVRPSWTEWTVFPAVGIGVGRHRAPGAPWMY